MFLAVDSRSAGRSVCQEAMARVARVPSSNLCTVPIVGTEPEKLGFAIGGWIESPDGQGLLIDTVRGLHYLPNDGELRNLRPRGGQSTHDLMRMPWSGDIVTSDMTLVKEDLLVETQATKGGHEKFLAMLPSIEAMLIAHGSGRGARSIVREVGGVYRTKALARRAQNLRLIADAPWLGYPIFDTRNGLQGVSRNGDLFALDIKYAEPGPRTNTGEPSHGSRQKLYRVPNIWSLESQRSILIWRKGWFRITEDLQWTPVTGLPSRVWVLAVLDEGRDDIVLGTSEGLYAIGAAGVARALHGTSSPQRLIRALTESPDGDGMLAGGDEGLFRISHDLSSVRPWTDDIYEIVGSVSSFVDARFAGFVLVQASNGTFVVEKDGKLSSVAALSPAAGLGHVTAFPRLQRVLARRRNDPGQPMIYEVRHGADVKCERPSIGG